MLCGEVVGLLGVEASLEEETQGGFRRFGWLHRLCKGLCHLVIEFRLLRPAQAEAADTDLLL